MGCMGVEVSSSRGRKSERDRLSGALCAVNHLCTQQHQPAFQKRSSSGPAMSASWLIGQASSAWCRAPHLAAFQFKARRLAVDGGSMRPLGAGGQLRRLEHGSARWGSPAARSSFPGRLRRCTRGAPADRARWPPSTTPDKVDGGCLLGTAPAWVESSRWGRNWKRLACRSHSRQAPAAAGRWSRLGQEVDGARSWRQVVAAVKIQIRGA